MRGDEQRVVDAVCGWLRREGWTIDREVAFCDVVAMYGHILHRMPLADDHGGRFAIVVPTEAVAAALRVPERVRALLRVEVYEVAADGTVRGISP